MIKKKKPSVEKKEIYPHFRMYLKSKHPTLIVGEHSKEEYKYRKVMHRDRDGRHLNEMIYPNPDPSDPAPMYIARRVRHDKKKYFPWKLSWRYPTKKKK